MMIKKLSLALVFATILLFSTACQQQEPVSSGISAPKNTIDQNTSTPTSNSPTTNDTDLESVFETAVTHTGINKAHAVIHESEQTRDDGRLVYDIEFSFSEYPFFSYEYDIDVKSGRVLDYKCDWDNALGMPDGLTSSFDITEDDAIALALQHAGVDRGDFTVKRVKATIDDGISQYQVEFYNNLVEYSYTLSGSSGTLMTYECEWQSYKNIR